MAVETVTLEDVKAAAPRIHPHVHRTPLLHSATLSDITGTDLWLKAENLQKTGSFKSRGGINATLQLMPEERSRGVISLSAGNQRPRWLSVPGWQAYTPRSSCRRRPLSVRSPRPADTGRRSFWWTVGA